MAEAGAVYRYVFSLIVARLERAFRQKAQLTPLRSFRLAHFSAQSFLPFKAGTHISQDVPGWRLVVPKKDNDFWCMHMKFILVRYNLPLQLHNGIVR